jgi:hypothetical protein
MARRACVRQRRNPIEIKQMRAAVAASQWVHSAFSPLGLFRSSALAPFGNPGRPTPADVAMRCQPRTRHN